MYDALEMFVAAGILISFIAGLILGFLVGVTF